MQRIAGAMFVVKFGDDDIDRPERTLRNFAVANGVSCRIATQQNITETILCHSESRYSDTRTNDWLGNATFCLDNRAHPRTGCGAWNGLCLADDSVNANNMRNSTFQVPNLGLPWFVDACRAYQPLTSRRCVLLNECSVSGPKP
jgi:hypothetical protein